MKQADFYKFNLPLERNLFEELSTSIDFEAIAQGRKGNQLVLLTNNEVPIVRTTTKYNSPAHNFDAIHHHILESINNVAQKQGILPLTFNNALIEIYDSSYTKMKYHSDQSLDLDPDSYIALFSCYERPEDSSEQSLRKLKVKDKVSNEEMVFTLENNSVILFPMTANTKFLHKIVLEQVRKQKALESENKWLGITFRTSKTFLHFKNDLAYFENGHLLTIANEAQAKEFYQLRGQENKSLDFDYPDLSYTLSLGDTLIPKS